jgi:hypothetical protein
LAPSEGLPDGDKNKPPGTARWISSAGLAVYPPFAALHYESLNDKRIPYNTLIILVIIWR